MCTCRDVTHSGYILHCPSPVLCPRDGLRASSVLTQVFFCSINNKNKWICSKVIPSFQQLANLLKWLSTVENLGFWSTGKNKLGCVYVVTPKPALISFGRLDESSGFPWSNSCLSLLENSRRSHCGMLTDSRGFAFSPWDVILFGPLETPVCKVAILLPHSVSGKALCSGWMRFLSLGSGPS